MFYLAVVVKHVAVSLATFFDPRTVDLLQSRNPREVIVVAVAADFVVIIGANVNWF
jgi:hypothetical protein